MVGKFRNQSSETRSVISTKVFRGQGQIRKSPEPQQVIFTFIGPRGQRLIMYFMFNINYLKEFA